MVARHAEPRRLARSEYERMGELGFFQGERVELIHGIVLRMAPIGPAHCGRVDVLMELFVQRTSDRATVRIQQPFVAHDESEPEPDVAVVPRALYMDRHPNRAHLIIEVAESSLDYDRETKAPLYAVSGVAEYWIVDVGGRAVEVHTEPRGDAYARVERFEPGAVLRPSEFPDVEVRVSDLFP